MSWIARFVQSVCKHGGLFLGGSHKGRRREAAKTHRAPHRWRFCEPLEDRKLLSASMDVFAGLADNNLSNAANYSSGSAPVAGDNLFLSGYTQTNINNDLSGLALGSIEFGTNYLNLGGNSFAATGDFISDSAVGDATISANIGGGDFRKTGDGVIALAGNNTWTGGTFVAGGTLVALSPGAIPDGSDLNVGNFNAFSSATTSLVLDSFTIDNQGQVTVQYTIDGTDAATFSIGIYSSADGTTPGNLLQTFEVSAPLDLVGGGTDHTATVDACLGELDGAHSYLLAKLDAYSEVPVTSTGGEIAPLSVPIATPLAGTFQQSDGSLYVSTSSDDSAKTVTISEDTATGDETVTIGSASETFQNVSAITISLDGGNDTVNASGVTVRMTIYGGSGSDKITAGDGDSTIYGGAAGGNTIHAGAGEDTIYGNGGTTSPGNTITGGAGEDTIYAGDGPDSITGGSGNNVIYAGAGYDYIFGGTGNNEIYGGSGTGVLDGTKGYNNYISGGSGSYTIYGGSGNDWLYGGAGVDHITGGAGTEKIYGGSGTNYLTGGSGLDDIYGGSGTNYIVGKSTNNDDVLVGGSGSNYILPNGTGLSSLVVEGTDHHSNLPVPDGNIDANGNAYHGDDLGVDAAYGYSTGLVEAYNNVGARLGSSAAKAPLAVYVTWDPALASLGGTQWAANAVYEVIDNGIILGTTTVNQQVACSATDSPVPNDRPWLRLGVWNVGIGDEVDVALEDAKYQPGDWLCAGDVMFQNIWPTLSVRTDEDGKGTFTTYDDYLNATNPAAIPVEGSGSRMEVDLNAAVDAVYKQLGSMSDWRAILPAVAGLEFWTAASGGTQLTPDGSGDLINDPFPSTGQYDRKVWVSIDPSAAATLGVVQIPFTVDPDGASVTDTARAEAVGSWTRDSWSGDPSTSTYTGHATAHGADATLRDLAKEITGNAGDYRQLIRANPGITINAGTTAVPDGSVIDISPLLQKLETTLRQNVATVAQSAIFAKFPATGQETLDWDDMDAADVLSVFSSNSSGHEGVFECEGMANIVMARGLIKTLKSGEFDDIFGTIGGMPRYKESTVALDNTKIGDWLYFVNDPAYGIGDKAKGEFQGQNVIETNKGPKILPRFAGWGGLKAMTIMTYDRWCAELVNHFNDDPPRPAKRIKSVPGYDGYAKFFDVALIAGKVFDYRTKGAK